MALITPNLKFYIPEIDDPNDIYLKGFADNFNSLDEKLSELLGTEIADTTSTENTIKRSVTDFMTHKWEGHILSHTDDPNQVANEGTYGIYYELNPHNTTAAQLYVPSDDQTGLLGRLTSADTIIYEVNNNLTIEGTGFARHRLNWAYVNTQQGKLSDIGTSIADRLHSDLLYATLDSGSTNTAKDKHLSNADAKKWEDHVDDNNKATANPHNTSAQALTSNDSSAIGGQAIQRAINQQGINDGINWGTVNKSGSNITEITTRNHDDLQSIGEVDNTSIDSTINKHVANLDFNNLYGHLLSVSSDDVDIKDIDGNGAGLPNHQTAKINPHEIRAKDMWSEDTLIHNHGADTIINEINVNGTSEGITTSNTADKIYWNLIDKNNIDGIGNGANINSIPNRSHQELQDIIPAVVTSSDTVKNRHVSDSQTKKWEEHVDDTDKNTANPHNTSAQNLKSSTTLNTGGVAIQEAINEQGTTDGIDWVKVDKSGSNLTEIDTRLHSDLQNIYTLDEDDNVDGSKNKHLSNTQANKWEVHVDTTDKATANPHNTSAQNLKSSTTGNTGGLAVQESINEQGIISGIDWVKVSKDGSNLTEITTRNHDDLQSIGQVDVLDSDATKNKHVSNLLARKWDLHSEYIAGGNPHRNTATNLYTIASEKNGGKAIAEAINLQALTSSIDWVKISKSGSNITDIVSRSHQDLQDILGATSSTDGTKDKHLSDQDYKNWEDHRANASNPHNVTAAQFGGNSIVDVINAGSTSSDINRDRLNLVGFNITEIENRDHDDLLNIGILDSASSDTAQNKHLSNLEAKKWEDHVDTIDGSNPHLVEAKNVPIDIITGVSGVNVQDALEDIALKTKYNSAGLLETTGTVTADGTGVLVQSNDFTIYHTDNFTGKLFRETIPQKHFLTEDFTDNKLSYIYAYYNTSTQALTYEVLDDLNILNWSNEVLCAFLYREGSVLEVGKLSDYGNGASEKMLKKDIEIDRFEVADGGLYLEDDSDKAGDGVTPINHHFKVTAGSVWAALENFQTITLTTRTTNLTWYYTIGDGSWETSSVGAPIIWQIDTGTGVENPPLTDIYVANWIYKDTFTDEWYIVLGAEGYDSETDLGYKLGYANAQPPVNLPNLIKERTILVGKVITEKDTVINPAIYKTLGLVFTNTSTGFQQIDTHNSLDGLQGGGADEYYHLTSTQISKLNGIESGADITDITNVGNAITQTIFNNTGDADVEITDIYQDALIGANDTVKLAGSRMTGTLSLQKTSGLLLAIGADGGSDILGGNDGWFRLGNNSYAYSHVYKGSESGNNNAYELWTTNGTAQTSTYNAGTAQRVWRITQDGIFNIYKNIIATANINVSSLTVNTTVDISGQTKITKGSTDWRDTVIFNDCSIQLGQSGGGYAGSLKLWGSDVGRYSLIRMHKTNLFFDTAGKYYYNWDATFTPGEFYLGDGEQYVTVEEARANYLVLRSNDKSYFQNGLQVGTTSNTTSYAMDIGDDVHLHNNDVNFLNALHFNSGTRFTNIASGTLRYSVDHATIGQIDFYVDQTGANTLKGRIRADGSNFGLQNSQGEWFIANAGGQTALYVDGVATFIATSSGATVSNDLIVNGTITEGGTLLSSKYLGLTAKAADSELLDGRNGEDYLYGINNTGSNNGRVDLNTIAKSGFYFCSTGSSNDPINGTGTLIHMNYDTSDTYNSQIYVTSNNSAMYIRSKENGSVKPWLQVYTTGFKPTKTDVGLGNLPNAKSDAINLADSNVLATSQAVKTAYDLASAASENAQNADNAHLLDNLDSTQFVRSDVNDSVDGVLTFNDDIKPRHILMNSFNDWSSAQKGLLVYHHTDGESTIGGFDSDGHLKIAHSNTGVNTDVDIDQMMVWTGNVYVKEVLARGNVNFMRNEVRKASMEYDETTNSIDFVF